MPIFLIENLRKDNDLKLILQLFIHQSELIECCYVEDPVDIKTFNIICNPYP